MTDLVTRHDADPESTDGDPTLSDRDTAVYEWAPADQAPKKRRWSLWIGIPAAVLAISLVIASLLLIAPGTAVAGVSIGGMTQGAAAEAIAGRLAATTIEFTGDGGDVTLTGAELGASVNADRLAAEAFAAHPAWQVAGWFGEAAVAPVTLDAAKATTALRGAMASLYVEPTNAVVAFDAATGNYAVTPAVAGQGIDLTAVHTTLQNAFNAGQTAVSMDAALVPVEASGTTVAAQRTADTLNAMLDGIGFYVGDERTVPIDRPTAASWLTLASTDDGTISVAADAAKIQQVVDTLPAAINRAPVNATVITDTSGNLLDTETAGIDGREVGDTSGVADAFAAQLSQLNGVYAVPVNTAAYTTTSFARSIVVNLSEQRTYLYENGAVVGSYLISSGTDATPTPAGSFRVFAHVWSQDMGELCYNPAAQDSYCTEDVPWVTYFAPDVGFHGTYWHSNFGNRMSHGCVNMTMGAAEFVYYWAPEGTEVTVTY